MSRDDTCRLLILVGNREWLDSNLAIYSAGYTVFDAHRIGASLCGLRAVIDEMYRVGETRIVVTMPHGEDDVHRVAFALRQTKEQAVYWVSKEMASPCLVKPWALPFKAIDTARLSLTLPTPNQITGYYNEIIGTQIFDTIAWEGPTHERDLHSFWLANQQDQILSEYPSFQRAIIEKQSGKYIGGCGLRTIGYGHEILNVGYTLAQKYHGIGLATEAVGALVQEGFNHLKTQRIIGEVFVGNRASARVLEKLGFHRESTQKHSLKKRQKWVDVWVYGLELKGFETWMNGRRLPKSAEPLER